MLEKITYFFTHTTIGNAIYYILGAFVLIISISYLGIQYFDNPKKRLDFVVKASMEGRCALGKLTCLTLHGHNSPQYYEAEYMYVVNDVSYFVTYKLNCLLELDGSKDSMNADMMLLHLKPAMLLFFNEKDPSKVMSKIEIFTSDNISQVHTPKQNAWRDINKEWLEPIDLVS